MAILFHDRLVLVAPGLYLEIRQLLVFQSSDLRIPNIILILQSYNAEFYIPMRNEVPGREMC